MYFKPYYLGCLAHASYLVGGSSCEAVVIDPRRDVDDYITDAESAGLRIAHVIETHLHADFVSGHVELARRTSAAIYMGAAAGAGFPHHAVHEGDTIDLGDVALRFLETPGHTPESMSIVLEAGGEPGKVFTGDTLFIGDVGRPDLAGGRGYTPEQMARAMYRSLATKLLCLPAGTEVWPAHGAGSACGRALSDEHSSTLGLQRIQNPALRMVVEGREEDFVRYATEGLSVAPAYFSFDAQRNRDGAAPIKEILRGAKPLTPPEVEELSEEGVIVLDTRSAEEFGAGHVPGAINVQLDGKFAPWVGGVIRPEAEFVVMAPAGRESEAITRLARIGYERIPGWLDGGINAWQSSGGEIVTVPQLDTDALRRLLSEPDPPAVLDVRAQSEWDEGHIDGAHWIPLPELEEKTADVPVGPLAVMCGTGYRSSIACSILQRAGRRDVANIAGGWEAWSGDAVRG